jgi:hypothetical protein
MTVKELLIKLGVPSKEVTQRLISGQIKLNGRKLSNPNFKVSNYDFVSELHELGDFLLFTCSPTALKLLPVLSPDPRLLFGTLDNESVNVQCLRHLAEWNVLQISKKESWVFKNNNITTL